MGWQRKHRLTELAREKFLELVRFYATPVLEDLSGEPFNLYLKAGISKPLVGSVWPKLVEGRDLKGDSHLSPLRERLIAWQINWHLLETKGAPKWVLATAVLTLAKWKETQGLSAISVTRGDPSASNPNINVPRDYLEQLLWWHPHYLSTKPISPISSPEGMPDYLFGYLLNGKTREQYLTDVRGLLLIQLKAAPLSLLKQAKRQALIHAVEDRVIEFCVKVENYCREEGWEPDNLKPRLHDHLIWAVKAQVLGNTYSNIAKEAEVQVSTVKRAVESTLNLLALTRRTDFKPGRRYGSKESPDSWRRATNRAQLLK